MHAQQEPFLSIRRALANQRPSGAVDPSLKLAAVLLLLIPEPGGLSVVFTKRTSRVEHHKGEVSFPGGAHDPEDRDLLTTALRETHEEIGVPPSLVQILGPLPPAVTLSSFLIHPFVGALTRDVGFAPNPYEVEEVFLVPLAALVDPATRREEAQFRKGQRVTAFAYYYRSHRVWGATARVLTSFLELVPQLSSKERLWAASFPASQR